MWDLIRILLVTGNELCRSLIKLLFTTAKQWTQVLKMDQSSLTLLILTFLHHFSRFNTPCYWDEQL